MADDEPQLRPPAWRRYVAALGVVVVAIAAWRVYAYMEERKRLEESPAFKRENYEGCPCGCDRSRAMAAELASDAGDARRAVRETLATIAEREALGYVTERMVEHRLRMLDVAKELQLDVQHGASTQDRCRTPAMEGDGLRVCAELVVHGERIERVKGEEKVITSSFRLWLEIENLGDAPRTLSPPSLTSDRFHFPVSRWYEEGGAGERWNGVVAAHRKMRVDVIGYVPEAVKPGATIDAAFAVGALTLRARTEALADIHVVTRAP